MSIASMVVVLGFTLIHFTSTNFSLKGISFRKFSSFVGGISLSYVFLHLMPTVSSYQPEISRVFRLEEPLYAYYLIFGAVFAGLIVFYLLETSYKEAARNQNIKNPYEIDSPIFWLYMVFYFLYNFIIGVLLSGHPFRTPQSALFYLVVVGLHFFTNDWVLNNHFPEIYHKYGRLFISLAVPMGWLSGTFFSLNPVLTGFLEAFVSGSMLLNAIQDELPEEQNSSKRSFLFGVVSYSLVLLFI